MSYWRFPTSIFVNYSVEEVIRSSGLSKVYKARHHQGGMPVAIKVLRLTPGLDEQRAEKKIIRFQREATLCVMADHAHIIRLLDFVHEPMHAPYAVYEYAPGITLKELIWKQRGLSGQTTATIMSQVLDALKASHAKGIVHRDLKPENIMVYEANGKIDVKLLDFGIGTWSEPQEIPGYLPITLPNEFLGTPAYAAPEQLIGQKPTTKFDLYAWGLILFECLTGKPAITGHSLSEVVCRQLAGDLVRLPRWMALHPIAGLLEKVLTRSPMGRMASVQRISEQFRKIDLSDLVMQPENKRSYASIPGQQTTMTQDFALHQDLDHEPLLVACIKLKMVSSESSPLSGYELEDLRVKEHSWLSHFIKSKGGKVVSLLADTFMITFNQPTLGQEFVQKGVRYLMELRHKAELRFKELERYQLKTSLSMSFNYGEALVESSGHPYGIVPNVALDLLTKTAPGKVLAGFDCKAYLNELYLLSPFEPNADSDQKAFLVNSL